MKIIDFEKKGNVVRFYLGKDELNEWYGDDWDDAPYECNAGKVYDEYITGYIDVAFDYDCLVLEPQDDWLARNNSNWCKNDMKNRLIPCIIVVPSRFVNYNDRFNYYLGISDVTRYYFGDHVSQYTSLENFFPNGHIIDKKNI